MTAKWQTAYIAVGSNLGDRKSSIEKAIALLGLLKGIRVARISSLYETEPVGGPPQGHFLNGVFEIRTKRAPLDLLGVLQGIERELGRTRGVRNGPRTIDLDILLYGNRRVATKKLTIPHPRMQKREFVLRGLWELRRTAQRS
jgi:2-amino-4-hydroxy-6-hydroxymethyldihydropteridine diphosphokinase